MKPKLNALRGTRLRNGEINFIEASFGNYFTLYLDVIIRFYQLFINICDMLCFIFRYINIPLTQFALFLMELITFLGCQDDHEKTFTVTITIKFLHVIEIFRVLKI